MYILTMNATGVAPLRIGSHDFIQAGNFIVDCLKFVTKSFRILLTGGTDIFAWLQAGASGYKIFHQFTFDPPLFLEAIMNQTFPTLRPAIQAVFEDFKAISDWLYVTASFLDPPSARLDLAIFDENGTLLLGFDRTANQTLQTSAVGFVVGNQYGQILLLNYSTLQAFNLSVLCTDLDGLPGNPLNFTLYVEDIQSNETWASGGYLEEGAETSTVLNQTTTGLRFPSLRCEVVDHVHPSLKVQVAEKGGLPIAVDNLTLYYRGEVVPVAIRALGEGMYIFEGLPAVYKELPLMLVVEKDGYLMEALEVMTTPAPDRTFQTTLTIVLIIVITGSAAAIFILWKRGVLTPLIDRVKQKIKR